MPELLMSTATAETGSPRSRRMITLALIRWRCACLLSAFPDSISRLHPSVCLGLPGPQLLVSPRSVLSSVGVRSITERSNTRNTTEVDALLPGRITRNKAEFYAGKHDYRFRRLCKMRYRK
jgi:hypothetical protein